MKVMQAARLYLQRQAGMEHPNSRLVIGSRGTAHFEPTEKEMRACCWPLQPAMRHRHCYSMRHIAMLYDVSYDVLVNKVRQLRAGRQEASAEVVKDGA